ncbi:MAG: DHA2 family efflux MFS transporter permease subunit [Bdellovibrionota bacterium]
MLKGSPLIVVVAVMASLLEIIDTSIVNVALPTMMGNLGATLEDISMVVTGYAIANAIILPASAWLSERIGRRKYYLGCIAAFTVTSVLCGIAPNLTTLIIFRIVQGAMGGALLPTSQTLIYEQFPKEKAGMAGAIFGMSVMIGPTLGPVMGGYLTDNFGWRSIFNINLPLGLLCLFIGYTVIFDREKEESAKHTSPELDSVGMALLIAGIGCFQYMLERGEASDWFASRTICACAAIAAASLPTFIWWELRVKNPIINVRLFLDPIVACGVTLMGALGFYLYSVVFLLPVLLSHSFNFTATQIGILFIPGSLITAFLMPFMGRAMMRGMNVKILIGIGFAFVELSLYLMTSLSPQSSVSQVLNVLYVRGIAMAFIFVPLNSSILSQFSGVNMSQVSGLMNLFRQLGGSIGIAAAGTLLTTRTMQNFVDLSQRVSLLDPATRAVYYQGALGLGGKMVDQLGLGTGRQAILKSLFGRMMGQAFMMSFLQLVWIVMIFFVFAYVPLYFLKLRFRVTKSVDSH